MHGRLVSTCHNRGGFLCRSYFVYLYVSFVGLFSCLEVSFVGLFSCMYVSSKRVTQEEGALRRCSEV